ncbi:MAG: DUF192 domain-containing protein [Methylococcales bacterium]
MVHKFRIFAFCYALTALSPLAASNAAQACGIIDRTAQIQVNDYRISVELAISEEEKACGLSFRDTLAEDHGMLFLYSDKQALTFWMKDTRIPLSIAFLEDNGTILNILEMQPMDSKTLYHSAAPARYVLEMPAKWFADHQVKPGDRVVFDLTAVLN